ncbi:hypothetical protein [Terrimonas pollutisoli]|uniref:hypothetical protein n=1 Tax=Terrimonas pollutisoli TaxID=3034147 RepID=UPI0023EACB9E|nr:hypothetical protein [Terrimonas sp. H1YJ31]
MITAIIIMFGIFTAIGAFISATHEIYDRSKTGLKRITKPGVWFIFCAAILVVLPAFQNYLSEEQQKIDQDKRDENLKLKYDNSILSMKKEFDRSNSSSAKLITETLGKYGYKVDSLNEVLINIRDSAKTRVIETEPPVFGICNQPCKGVELVDTSNGSYKFRISFQSEDAGSSYFKLNISTVIEDTAGSIYQVEKYNSSLIPFNLRMSKDAVISTNKTLITKIRIAKIYFWVKGSYKRIDGNGNYPINEVYIYALKEKFTQIASKPSLKQRIVDLVSKNER